MKTYKAAAVIGAGYGDEGKGLMTDYYVSRMENDPIVVRFNGGAQAGHTVQLPNGHRHVFSHFGSGTFAGAPTYLSEFFVVNPLMFVKEHTEFVKTFGFKPRIMIDSRAEFTSPYEMLINQTLEQSREAIHGSVGVGFGETLERIKQMGMSLRADVMLQRDNDSLIKDSLALIRMKYLLARLDEDNIDQVVLDVINSDKVIEQYMNVLWYLRIHVEEATPFSLWNHDVVFEGAQGLLLDQDYGYFPHVTRSNCGMKNVTELMRDIPNDWDELEVNYVTRSYTTRHGAGPLEHEQKRPVWLVDDTNVENEWQGPLRYAPLNWDLFEMITDKDYAMYGGENDFELNWDVRRVNTMTHIDQIQPNNYQVVTKGEVFNFSHEAAVGSIIPGVFQYGSAGPTRDHVKQL